MPETPHLSAATPSPPERSPWETVAIIGVGLIGGSIGRALLERGLARRVVGIGRNAARLKNVKKIGAITDTSLDLAKGVSEADVVIVCTPVDLIAEQAVAAVEHAPAHALVSDAGSTKHQIVSAVEKKLRGRGHFVGSHPMAGSEKAGAAESRADLFEGKVVVVTPSKRTPAADAEAIGEFWASLGARVLMMGPDAHDRAVAATSHLPHLLASILAGVTLAEDAPLVASGWLDTTRIAGGDPELWRQIFQSNDKHLLEALKRFEKQLTAARRALEKGDAARLTKLLAQGKAVRDALGN
jgi:prephenate dehydrogenase